MKAFINLRRRKKHHLKSSSAPITGRYPTTDSQKTPCSEMSCDEF